MKKPYEIVILSGKGGTGKTSITAAFASLSKNTVFCDCDVDAADLHLILSPYIYYNEKFPSGARAVARRNKCDICGLCQELCRFDAIDIKDDKIFIDEYACEGCGLCAIACPTGAIIMEKHEKNHIIFGDSRFGPMIYGTLGIAEENSGRLVSKIREYARKIANRHNSDLILTDGPPGIGCPVISSVTGSNLVIAVTEPTLSGWHDLERLINLIGNFKTTVKVIINKFDLNKKISDLIENNLNKNDIELIGKIPYNDSMIKALVKGETINEFEPQGALTSIINEIWANITTEIYGLKSV